ncbi:MAG: type IX secretion system membrane protein PorP/SprF [Bacteroidota bacterium]|nr:type IX secretion system membrane protein PorP/SprF [Bacteroidota bacterium]
MKAIFRIQNKRTAPFERYLWYIKERFNTANNLVNKSSGYRNIRAFVIVFLSCTEILTAQQDAGFSQYFFNQLYINPAYAGSRQTLAGTLVHRSQWVAMPGAPATQSLTLHTPLAHTHAGIGLQVYHDKTGPLNNTGIQATYSYRILLGKYKLAFGLNGSAHNLRISFDEINVDDKTDPSFLGKGSSWIPDAGCGVYLYRNRLYAGLSALHIIQPKFNLGGSENAKFYRQYYFTGGMVFGLNENVDFRPSVLLKWTTAAPITTDLNASFIFRQRFFIGCGFRTAKRINISGSDNQLVLITEYNISNTLRIGYSYDWYLSRSGNYNSGTHEIMLGWDINLNRTKMTSPIFF